MEQDIGGIVNDIVNNATVIVTAVSAIIAGALLFIKRVREAMATFAGKIKDSTK